MPENLALVHMVCNQAKGSDCPCDWYDGYDNGWYVWKYCTPEIHYVDWLDGANQPVRPIQDVVAPDMVPPQDTTDLG